MEPKAGLKMNRQLYRDLVVWLAEKRTREGVEEWQKNILITTGRQYHLIGTILYQKLGKELLPII